MVAAAAASLAAAQAAAVAAAFVLLAHCCCCCCLRLQLQLMLVHSVLYPVLPLLLLFLAEVLKVLVMHLVSPGMVPVLARWHRQPSSSNSKEQQA